MRTILYLAYGSNLLPARLAARLDHVAVLGTAELPGWALRFHKVGADGSAKCNLVEAPGALAFGAIYALSHAEQKRLDEIEGVGRGYHGITIELPAYGNAYVYLAQPTHIEESLAPFDWYLDFVIGGARYHDFPESYIERIAAVASVADPDEQRRRANYRILGEMPAR